MRPANPALGSNATGVLDDHPSSEVRPSPCERESEMLTEMARALLRVDVHPAGSLQLLSDHASQIVNAEGTAVALITGELLRAESASGSLAEHVGVAVPLSHSHLAIAIAERTTLIINDCPSDPRLRQELVARFGVRQLIVSPMIVADQPVGALVAINSVSGGFTETEGAMLDRLAAHAALAVRNASLYGNAERRAREARTLSEMIRNLNQSLEVDRVFALVADHAAGLLGASASRVAMVEDDQLMIVAAAGDQAGEIWRVPAAESGCAQSMISGAAVRVSDARGFGTGWRWGEEGASNAIVAVPLRINGRPLGALVVLGRAGQEFEVADEELLTALASHAAIAIENARLFRASVRTMHHASILAAAARSLALHVTPEALYADLWRLARESLGADGIGIYTLDPEDKSVELMLTAGIAAEDVREQLNSFWDGLAGKVLPLGSPAFISDLSRENDVTSRTAYGAGVHSVALLPLLLAGRPAGLLTLRFRTRQAFHHEQQHLFRDLASHAAVAVRNAQMFAGLEAQTMRERAVAEAERQQREEAEAAAAIARVALRSHRVASAAAQMLAIVEAVLPATSAALALRREDGAMRYVATRGGAADLQDTELLPGELTGAASDRAIFRHLSLLDDVRDRHTPIGMTMRLPPVAKCVADTVLPLVSGAEMIGILALGPAPTCADRDRRQNALSRLGPPLSLALATILLHEEERRVAEQLRQSERLAALGELVAGVAHEVNNPLTGISAFAQLLQEEPLTEDQLESVRLIKKESDRAVAVMRDLLTFARKAGPRMVEVQLNQLVEQTMRLRTYGLRTMGIAVKLELDTAVPPVRGDDRQLQQVLLNLVLNAEHAMAGRADRKLTLRTRNESDMVLLEVSDSGVGMSAEVQRRVFEPFFTTKNDGQGTGLGLSVSYGIIRNHHGTLEVESNPGMGTTFRIALPALERDDLYDGNLRLT